MTKWQDDVTDEDDDEHEDDGGLDDNGDDHIIDILPSFQLSVTFNPVRASITWNQQVFVYISHYHCWSSLGNK